MASQNDSIWWRRHDQWWPIVISTFYKKNSGESLIKTKSFSLTKMHFIMWAKCRPFCSGIDMSNFNLCHIPMWNMMTSSNGNIFRVTGPLCREFTGHWWIPLTKASDAELWCFLWSAPWINGWVNNRDTGDLRCHHAHYDVSVMKNSFLSTKTTKNNNGLSWFEFHCSLKGGLRYTINHPRKFAPAGA